MRDCIAMKEGDRLFNDTYFLFYFFYFFAVAVKYEEVGKLGILLPSQLDDY